MNVLILLLHQIELSLSWLTDLKRAKDFPTYEESQVPTYCWVNTGL